MKERGWGDVDLRDVGWGQSRAVANPVMNLRISYRRGCVGEVDNQQLFEKDCSVCSRKVDLASVLWI